MTRLVLQISPTMSNISLEPEFGSIESGARCPHKKYHSELTNRPQTPEQFEPGSREISKSSHFSSITGVSWQSIKIFDLSPSVGRCHFDTLARNL